MTSIPRRSIHVTGSIELEPAMGAFAGAQLIVLLEDNSVVDVSADVLAKQVIAPLAYDGGVTVAIPFDLEASVPGGEPFLCVRAHLAHHAGNAIEMGDWVTTQMFRVRASEVSDALRVFLRPV